MNLLKDGIFKSNLKQENTLFDPQSRKMAIIDLGSSLFIEKEQNIAAFDISIGGYSQTYFYIQPEISKFIDEPNDDEYELNLINLKKSISYLCGNTVDEVAKPHKKKNERFSLIYWD